MKLNLRILKTVLRNQKNLIFKNRLKHLKRKCFRVLRQKQSCSHGVKNGCKNLQCFSFKPLKPFCLSSEQGLMQSKKLSNNSLKLYQSVVIKLLKLKREIRWIRNPKNLGRHWKNIQNYQAYWKSKTLLVPFKITENELSNQAHQMLSHHNNWLNTFQNFYILKMKGKMTNNVFYIMILIEI